MKPPTTKQPDIIKRQVLPSRIFWKGEHDTFVEYQNGVIGHFLQIGAGCMFDPDFQDLYLEHGIEAVDHWDEHPFVTKAQFKQDLWALFGALFYP